MFYSIFVFLGLAIVFIIFRKLSKSHKWLFLHLLEWKSLLFEVYDDFQPRQNKQERNAKQSDSTESEDHTASWDQ